MNSSARTDTPRSGTRPPIDPVDALVLDLLEWIAPGARPYAEVMDVWRTSCPRLPVWEEANGRGYLSRQRTGTGVVMVELTPAGRAVLAQSRSRSDASR